MWILYGLLAALAAALMTIAGKIGIKNVDPTIATTIRACFMAVLMIAVSVTTKKTALLSTIDGKALRWIAVAAVFGALSWLFYFLGLQQTSASKLAALDRLSLPLIILFSVLLLNEKLTWQLALGGILVAGGAILIART